MPWHSGTMASPSLTTTTTSYTLSGYFPSSFPRLPAVFSREPGLAAVHLGPVRFSGPEENL